MKKETKKQNRVFERIRRKVPKIKVERYLHEEPDESKVALIKMWKSMAAIPTFNYYALLCVIIVLSVIGLVMQFSASTILELSHGENPYWGIAKPMIVLCVGFFGLWALAKIPPRFYNGYAGVIMLLGLAIQTLVKTPLGRTANGNTNWIKIPGTSQVIQPSEFLKIALIIFLTMVFATGRCNIRSFKSVLIWVGIPFILSAGFVMLGRDLGTMIIFLGIVFCVVIVAGIRITWLLYGSLSVGLLLVVAVLTSQSRRKRLIGYWNAEESDPMGVGLQPLRAKWGLGTGGLTGVGPGASRQKWNYLPEAHTDFILAIIGEEFGLVGTLTVVALFAFLALLFARLIIQSHNLSTRICAAGAAGWIVMQAAVNILVVVGSLPVVGVPLPLVSSGGSAQLSTLLMVGVILSFIKHEPGLAQYLQHRPRSQRNTVSVKQLRNRNRRTGHTKHR